MPGSMGGPQQEAIGMPGCPKIVDLRNVGYFRTSWHNFTVTDNLAVTPLDYDPYCITAPVNARLPNSGQQVCGFYNISEAQYGVVDNLVTKADYFGQRTEVYNGVDVTLTARLPGGGVVGGGP